MRSRQYQMRTIEAVESVLQSGRVPLVVAPTGSGKTWMARRSLQQRKKAVAIVHTNVLKEQTRDNIPEADVLTVQSLISRGPKAAARRALLLESDIVWVDEAHHLVSGEWKHVGAMLRENRIPTFLSTATPERSDGTSMADVADEMVVAANYSELISLGHLCQCDMLAPEIGRWAQKQMKVRPDGVASYLEHGRRPDGTWRAGIHTENTIAECEEAAQKYNEAGVRAEVVCMGVGNRQEIFARYTAGHLDMLCSPMALSEGFDSPRAKVFVSRRQMSGLSMYLQWGGRVLRPWNEAVIERWRGAVARYGLEMTPEAARPDMRALYIDCTGAREQHGHITQDRQYSLERGIEDVPEDVPEPEEDEEKEAREPPEKPKDIQVKYKMLRDTLVERYVELEAQATERGYAAGWVYHRMRELGLEPPRAMASKFRSVCVRCRKRMEVGAPMFWDGPGKVLHRDCWFDSLTPQQLEQAAEKVSNGA